MDWGPANALTMEHIADDRGYFGLVLEPRFNKPSNADDLAG